MRKVYLDNLRWTVVLLVLAYHVCYLFNGVGVPGGIPQAESIPLCDAAACVVYPWFMALLFVVAGMSARYSLQKRTGKQFLKERAVKLLIPSTLGLFVFHWLAGYLNIRMGGGLAYIPKVLLYPVCAVSGTGPLWFIQMLFLFSGVLVLLRRLDRKDRLWTLGGRANLPVICMLFLPVYGAAQIGNLPVLTMYRFGIYFVSFLIGYCIFSHEEVQERMARACLPMLCAAVAGGVVYAFSYCGTDYTSPVCLQSPLTNLYLWMVILALIGSFRRYFDRETALSRYMTGAGFGIYILHYPILLAVCYVLRYHLDWSPGWNYAVALVSGTVLTFAAYEGIKRMPGVRYAVLGMGGKRN